MTKVTFNGTPFKIKGSFPSVGSVAPNAVLTKQDLSKVGINSYRGSKLVINIFPSLDTSVCAASVKKFNQEAALLENTKIICVSKDLPFALARFCAAEGIEHVEALSDFPDSELSSYYNAEIMEGPLKGLAPRGVIILDEQGVVQYSELVKELTQEPNYKDVIQILKGSI